MFAWQDSESKMNFKTEVVAWCRVGNCVRPIDKNTFQDFFVYHKQVASLVLNFRASVSASKLQYLLFCAFLTITSGALPGL